MTDFLLRHGTIVTVDKERRIIENGALAIEGDRIVDIGTVDELDPRHSDKAVIDCRGKLLIPGLIDAHATRATPFFAASQRTPMRCG